MWNIVKQKHYQICYYQIWLRYCFILFQIVPQLHNLVIQFHRQPPQAANPLSPLERKEHCFPLHRFFEVTWQLQLMTFRSSYGAGSWSVITGTNKAPYNLYPQCFGSKVLSITINSCLSKLFNLLLNNRLLCFINENNILKSNQMGFRKGFRTADHVLTMKTLMDKYLSENKKLCICFVDSRNAYDSIWREDTI